MGRLSGCDYLVSLLKELEVGGDFVEETLEKENFEQKRIHGPWGIELIEETPEREMVSRMAIEHE